MTNASTVGIWGAPHATAIRPSIKSNSLSPPYGTRELIVDIRRLRSAWKRYRRARQRQAVYALLGEIFEVAALWRLDCHVIGRTRRLMNHRGCKSPKVIEPFRDLIVAVSHPVKLDRRTVAKWSRVLRYAHEYKIPGRPLDLFVMRRGGINGCAALYTRRLGRKSKLAKKRLISSRKRNTARESASRTHQRGTAVSNK